MEMKNVLLFLGANSSAANISLDSSVLNIDNTTIYEEDTDTESILGQAHHMLSRFLNLGIFFTIFFHDFFSRIFFTNIFYKVDIF